MCMYIQEEKRVTPIDNAWLKHIVELSPNLIIIDVIGQYATFEEAWYCIHVAKNSESSSKLLLISLLSRSDIWAAFKIPGQRLLLINACTASQL